MKRIRIRKRWFIGGILFFVLPPLVVFAPLPPKGYIPVLMYHFIFPQTEVGKNSLNVGIKDFQYQMWFLKTFGFRPISLDEYYAIQTGQAKPRGREVVITFDDGHKTYLENAFPILERYHIPSANFLIWAHLNRGWNDDMSLEQVKRLLNHPLITFGSHTLTHPNLSKVSIEEAHHEIFQSKAELENALSQKIHYFCYPDGAFNQDVMDLVKAAAYRLAFRTGNKSYSSFPETLYSIRRIKVRGREGLVVFLFQVLGIRR